MELIYREARDLGVIFIKYTRDTKPAVKKENDILMVDVFAPIMQTEVSIQADCVILAAAIEPNDTAPFVDLFKCSGMVHPDLMLDALKKGADGIMVMG